MHGTIPTRSYEKRSAKGFSSLWAGLGFGLLPLVLAGIIAILRFGGAVSFADVTPM
jgi:hypothetical protein